MLEKYKNMRTTRYKNNKMIIAIIATSLIVLALVAGGVYWFSQKDEIKRDENGISTERTPQDRKLEDELQNNPELKEQASQTDHAESATVDPDTQLKVANVVITNAGVSGGEVSASGFITNIVDDQGSCEYLFTKNSVTVAKPAATLSNPGSTTCKTVRFSSDELSPGVWKVQLKYSSETSSGKSNALEITIP